MNVNKNKPQKNAMHPTIFKTSLVWQPAFANIINNQESIVSNKTHTEIEWSHFIDAYLSLVLFLYFYGNWYQCKSWLSPANLFFHRPLHAPGQHQAQLPETVHPVHDNRIISDAQMMFQYFKTSTVHFLNGKMSSIIHWCAMPKFRLSLVGLNTKRCISK